MVSSSSCLNNSIVIYQKCDLNKMTVKSFDSLLLISPHDRFIFEKIINLKNKSFRQDNIIFSIIQCHPLITIV
jgi:hypothetical protein